VVRGGGTILESPNHLTYAESRVDVKTFTPSLIRKFGFTDKLRRFKEFRRTKRFGLTIQGSSAKGAGKKKVTLTLKPKKRTKLTLVINEKIKRDEVALFHIKHYDDGGNLMGGLSVLFTGDHIFRKKPTKPRKIR
jgi:hypothetical protein